MRFGLGSGLSLWLSLNAYQAHPLSPQHLALALALALTCTVHMVMTIRRLRSSGASSTSYSSLPSAMALSWAVAAIEEVVATSG